MSQSIFPELSEGLEGEIKEGGRWGIGKKLERSGVYKRDPFAYLLSYHL